MNCLLSLIRQKYTVVNKDGFEVDISAAKAGGRIARQARRQLEDQTGKSVVSGDNYLPPKAAKSALKAPPK